MRDTEDKNILLIINAKKINIFTIVLLLLSKLPLIYTTHINQTLKLKRKLR